MAENYRFDESIDINLRRDEAIVLAYWLVREVYNEDQKNVRASFVHPAEAHSLLAVLQEIWRNSDEISEIAGMDIVAREHLLKRHT